MARSSLPLSPSDGAAAAHIAELRAQAQRHKQVRSARSHRVAWPVAVVTALRESVADALAPSRSVPTAACTTC